MMMMIITLCYFQKQKAWILISLIIIFIPWDCQNDTKLLHFTLHLALLAFLINYFLLSSLATKTWPINQALFIHLYFHQHHQIELLYSISQSYSATNSEFISYQFYRNHLYPFFWIHSTPWPWGQVIAPKEVEINLVDQHFN